MYASIDRLQLQENSVCFSPWDCGAHGWFFACFFSFLQNKGNVLAFGETPSTLFAKKQGFLVRGVALPCPRVATADILEEKGPLLPVVCHRPPAVPPCRFARWGALRSHGQQQHLKHDIHSYYGFVSPNPPLPGA